jgi:hypothetical protein
MRNISCGQSYFSSKNKSPLNMFVYFVMAQTRELLATQTFAGHQTDITVEQIKTGLLTP